MKIKVLMMPADRKAYITYIANSLKNMQKAVGGYIETITLAKDVVMVINEEGKLLGLPDNRNIDRKMFKTDRIVGDCFICGVDGSEFADIPDCAKRLLLASCREAWEENA